MKRNVGFADFMYVLDADGRTPVQVTEPMEWAIKAEQGMRDGSFRVGHDMVGKSEVSTVFLGTDMNHGLWDGPPVLFETMVFGPGGEVESCDRCCTWDEAEKLHEHVVQKLRNRQKEGDSGQ